jgi:ABC-type nitrate/sulfonate/bicarbonate transport system substrate-binding protein
MIQNIYVPVDSPIRTIEDLRGKKLGVFSRNGGAEEALRVILLEETGLDIFDPDQVELVVADSPVLYALAEKGEVDAQFQISSLTIRAASRPDQWRELFSPNDWWRERTGQPLAWTAPVVAWRDWVEEDIDRARRLVNAYHESYEWLRDPDNLQTTVDKYGELAGVTDQAQAGVYKQWLQEGRVFLTKWDQATIDSQWEFLELALKHGSIDNIPPKNIAARALE